MRQRLPAAIAAAVGALVLLSFFTDNSTVAGITTFFILSAMIVAAFAFLLGVLNVLMVHLRKIGQRESGWGYSLALLFGMLAVLFFGRPGTKGPAEETVSWILRNVQIPLQATFFALLAFFVIGAAYHALQTRPREASVMLIVAAIVLVGQVPLGQRIWSQFPALKDWLVAVPATAGVRGLLLGAALGTVAMGLRLLILTDRERYFK
jgi:hypothetical protein